MIILPFQQQERVNLEKPCTRFSKIIVMMVGRWRCKAVTIESGLWILLLHREIKVYLDVNKKNNNGLCNHDEYITCGHKRKSTKI